MKHNIQGSRVVEGRRSPVLWRGESMACVAGLLLSLTTGVGRASEPDADWQARIQADIQQSEYNASLQPDPAHPAEIRWQAPNRAHGWRIWFRPEGLCVVERTNAVSSFDWRMELQSYGRPGAGHPVPSAQVQAYSNRVEYARDSLVEWYINSPAGLEQGFTLAQPPTGSGDVLELVMALPGTIKACVSDSRDAVDFGRPGQTPLIRYGQLKTVDAAGRALRSWFEGGGDELRIVVEARDAQYPIVVDPLATSAGWTAESDQASANLGFSVASAGDVNGDGYGDLIVGARLYDNGENNEGRAYVYHGSASGLSATAAWFAEGNQASAYFGYSVSGAGDVNGDGYADVIVGANAYDNGQTDEGRAFVYHGSASGLDATAAWTAESDQASAFFGTSVAGAGDVNGDGYADVMVGAYSFDNGESNEGRTYVYHGSASGLSATAAWTAESNQSDSLFGEKVSGAGDVNGDGYADVIVGARGFDNGQNNEGRAYVYHGSASGLGATAAWTAESNQDGANMGASVSGAGDVNGDGYADVIVGAEAYDNGQTDEGRAYVYHGSASGLSASAAWTAESNQGTAYFGASVSGAGDVNGDGYADVIVGAILYDNGQTDEGRAYVYHGSAAGLSATAAWTAESDQAEAYYGSGVSGAGDVNGDGYADVIVGARLYDNGQTDEGRAFVYHGSASGLSTTSGWTAESDQANAYLGHSVSSAGDVNGDGYADVIVGVYGYDNGQSNEGRAYVYHGSASGMSVTAAWTAEANQVSANFGTSVAGAGDVNGDGYADVIVGANAYDNGQTDEGRAYVYHGSASGMSATAAWTAEANQASASFGISVAGAGDVNGDGYADVIVGAYYYDNGQTDEGRAYVYHGSASGLSATAAWTAESDQLSAVFGCSVSGAGDVNGDGYADVIVGALYFDNGQAEEGRAYVYHGSASGLSATAGWTAESDQASANFGYSVARAGDVDGDGYADVIVSAYRYDNGQTDEGRAYVYHGSASGLSATAGWTAESDQVSAYFGCSVSGAGDVNGDGYADVIVGALYFDNGQTDEGRAYVYHGSASGLSATAGWTAESDQASAYFGCGVSGAGDVNGDGYADVIVGARLYDNGQTDEGRAFLYYGGGTRGLSLRPGQQRVNSSTFVAAQGVSDSSDGFNLVLTARSPAGRTKAKLEWQAAPGTVAFGAAGTVSGVSAAWTDTGVAGLIMTQQVSGLASGTNYHWRLRLRYSSASTLTPVASRWLYGPNGGAREQDLKTMSGPSMPAAPTALAASSVAQTSFSANWTASSGATNYVLDVATDSGFTSYVGGYQNLAVGNVQTYAVSGLTANQTYYYRVRAQNSGGTSGNSGTVTVTTLPNAPSAPTALAASSVAQTSFSANWTASSGATNYVLDVATDSGFSSYVGGYQNLAVGNVQTYAVSGLTAGQTYYYRVRAQNSGGTSGNSSTIAATTTPSVPASPVAFAGSDFSSNSFQANWGPAANSIYVGGSFTRAGSVVVNGFAKWDGASWSAVGSLEGTVWSILPDGNGNVYVGGQFYNAAGVGANCIAKWNGTAWQALGTGINGPVFAMALDSYGNLYAGGFFTTAGGTSASRIAKWNGTTWSALGSGISGSGSYPVAALAADDSGNVYVGGDFTAAGGVSAPGVAKWNGSAWSALGSGVTKTGGGNGYVHALTWNSTAGLYVGGEFITAGGVSAKNVAQWNGTTWSALGSGANVVVYALQLDGAGNLYVGGGFSAAGGVPANLIAKWNGSAWSALAGGLTGVEGGAGYAYTYGIAIDALGRVYAGGTFTTAGVVRADCIAVWQNGTWSDVSGGLTTPGNVPNVLAVASASSATGYGGVPTNYLLDVATDSAFSSFISGYQDRVMGTNLSYVVTGLNGEQTYYYRVRAQNESGTSGNSGTITVTTLPNAPSAPTALAASSVAQTSFSANWTASSGATNYVLDVATDSGFTSYVGGYQSLAVGNVQTYAVAGLTANQTYYYRVRAQNSGGTSGNSGTVTVTTLPNAPSAPTALAASSVAQTSFSANWTASSGATNYVLDVAADSGFTSYVGGYQNLAVGNVLTYAVSGLTAGQTYYYRVRAQNSGGTSGNSGAITVMTQAGYAEIQITGNGQDIANGDNSPESSDGTDFGTAIFDNGSSVVGSFTIENRGTVALAVGPATILGDASGDFTVSSQPAGTVVAGGQTTVSIRFDPSAAATRDATVSFATSDTDENPFTFALRGRGIMSPSVFITNLAASSVSGVATISVATTDGSTYALYSTDTLRSDSSPSWTVMAAGQYGDGSVQNRSDVPTGVMRRYYQVAIAGQSPATGDAWGLVRWNVAGGTFTMMSPPVRCDRRFDGMMGQMLGESLSGDDDGVGGNGDEVYVLQPNGSWRTLYLNAEKQWRESSGQPSSYELAPGQGFFVLRQSESVQVTMTGPVGNDGTRTNELVAGWNMIGVSEGMSLPIKQTLATASPVGGASEESADLLVLQNPNGSWRRFMYVQGWGAPYDGNWFDLSTFQIATNRLEPGAAYYYLRRASGGATSIRF